MEKVLVIAPHADDEILGCGGTIKRLIKRGAKVYVLIVTNAHVGAPERYTVEGINRVRGEAMQSHQFLGVTETLFMDFPAPCLDTYPSYKIALAISEVINRYAFDSVFVPHRGDIHKDHKVVFDAALVACRPVKDCPVHNIYAYETLSETEWAVPSGSEVFIPNIYISLAEDEFQAKKEALAFFKSQMRPFPQSRSLEAIEALAKYRGATITVPRAEAFMLIRRIL